MTKENWLLVIVAAAACGWLGYTDKILDLQDAERMRQDDCQRVMNGLGEVPGPLTSYCYGVKPKAAK